MAALPSVACLDPTAALQPDIVAHAPALPDQGPQLSSCTEFQRAIVILQAQWRARSTRRRYLALVHVISNVQRAWRLTLTKRRQVEAQQLTSDKSDHAAASPETACTPVTPTLTPSVVSTSPLPRPLAHTADSSARPASSPPPTPPTAPVPLVAEPRRSLRSSARLTSNRAPSSGSDTQSKVVPERHHGASNKKQTKSLKPVQSAADLESLSVAELRQLTAANTQRNKRYRHCSLDLVIVHKDCPRPESPEFGPSDAGDPSDNSQGIEPITDAQVSLLPFAPTSLHTSPAASSIADEVEVTSVSSDRQLRWHAQLAATSSDADKACSPDVGAPPPSRPCLKSRPLLLAKDGPASANAGADPVSSHACALSNRSLPCTTSPKAVTKVCIQRFLYTDDDLNDPDVIEQLKCRDEAYEQVYETTPNTDQDALANAMAVDNAATTSSTAQALAKVDTFPSLDHLFVHTLQLANVTNKVLKKPTRTNKRRKKSR
ncbi:hypothetical protein H4R35_004614 [Dimargaris xerosporica]|nr:hypothetical protein H4R35_004614 [Dimargaris xerosporica]